LLYVQPVYVRATANNSAYPLLQKVLVSFGDVIGFDDSLKGALDQVFGGNSGTVLNNTSQSNSNGSTTPSANSSLKSALASAKAALADSQAALKKGDFTAYGKAQDRLKAAIAAAIAAQK